MSIDVAAAPPAPLAETTAALRTHLARRIRHAVHSRDLGLADQIAADAVEAFVAAMQKEERG